VIYKCGFVNYVI